MTDEDFVIDLTRDSVRLICPRYGQGDPPCRTSLSLHVDHLVGVEGVLRCRQHGDLLAEESGVPVEEPVEPGWYTYSGGTQAMIFHLRETGQWSVHLDDGTAHDCAWGYVEQALGVWDLVRLEPEVR